MAKTITLREANQAFSRIIREVEAGEEITITRNGEPVARLVPVRGERVLTPEQQAARARARARWKKGWDLGVDHPLNRRLASMNGSDRFTLDTNLLVYSVDRRSGTRHRLAIEIVDQAIRQGLPHDTAITL